MKLPAKWEVTVASKYAEGCSDEEVCKALKMPMTAYKRLYGSDPNFREAVDNGRGVAKAPGTRKVIEITAASLAWIDIKDDGLPQPQ